MIAAGKHVLVEKCFAMNEHEATEMVEAARKKVVRSPSTLSCTLAVNVTTVFQSMSPWWAYDGSLSPPQSCW